MYLVCGNFNQLLKMYYLKSTFSTFFVIFALNTNIATSFGSSIDGRIIAGATALAGEFPFSAAVYIHTDNGRYFCGGSLISNQWILTAAQCADGPLTFTIVLGANNLQESNSNRVTVTAEEHYLHPDYDPLYLQNDIALIKLKMPVEFNAYIQPIALPSAELVDHTAVVAIGWGQISDNDTASASDLYKVTMIALTNEECRLTYGVSTVTDQMVCAKGSYNQGTCSGDSGSPLIRYRMKEPATHVAVSSWFSGNGCETTDPSGFTRTFPYVDWIRNVTGIV